MNKVKMFFVAAALLLTTAGVFAGKAKFVAGGIYAYNSTISSTYFPLTAGQPALGQLQLTGTNQALISDNSSQSFGVYYYNGTSFVRAYSTSLW